MAQGVPIQSSWDDVYRDHEQTGVAGWLAGWLAWQPARCYCLSPRQAKGTTTRDKRRCGRVFLICARWLWGCLSSRTLPFIPQLAGSSMHGVRMHADPC